MTITIVSCRYFVIIHVEDIVNKIFLCFNTILLNNYLQLK